MSQARVIQHEASDPQTLAQDLARAIALTLRQTLQEQGRATLAVSGGRSPVALFDALSCEALPWQQVTVLLVDERCVPPGHPDSNAGLVRHHLLKGPGAAARFVPLIDDLPESLDLGSDETLQRLADQANARLQAVAWPVDVLVLGMGEDGHTASLFPASPGLDTALQAAAPVAWVRPLAAPHPRLTLTLPRLLDARAIHLPVSGPAKARMLERALADASTDVPVSLVLHGALGKAHLWRSP